MYVGIRIGYIDHIRSLNSTCKYNICVCCLGVNCLSRVFFMKYWLGGRYVCFRLCVSVFTCEWVSLSIKCFQFDGVIGKRHLLIVFCGTPLNIFYDS